MYETEFDSHKWIGWQPISAIQQEFVHQSPISSYQLVICIRDV